MDQDCSSSPFVPLPSRFGPCLRLLGPRPEQAATTVEPLVRLDQPAGPVQSFVGGLCSPDGRLAQPVEVPLLVDPLATPPNALIPTPALLHTFRTLAELHTRLPAPAGFELLHAGGQSAERLPPLLYCRKRHRLFLARSPNTGAPLTAAPDSPPSDAATAPDGLPLEFAIWDGPSSERPVAVYAGRRGTGALGPIEPFDQLIRDQGKVVALAEELAARDLAAHAELVAQHVCCTCSERGRCFPSGGGYAFAADRLVLVHANEAPLLPLPLGEWRLDEAARLLGGAPPDAACSDLVGSDNTFELWRRERMAALAASGRRFLLAKEPGGRDLAEIVRLKLGLIADVLAQLDAAWRAAGRPHLCWNDQTVRVTWSSASQTPASAWGLRALLRKIGWQPLSDVQAGDGRHLPYPPALSSSSLLPPEVVEAQRYFGTPRGVNVFVRLAEPAGGPTARVGFLLEDLGVARELFCPGDVVRVVGPGWQAELTPAVERRAEDGAGLGVQGTASGDVTRLKAGESFDACECRWYPCFAEAVDLYAVGMLLFETLLAHDESDGPRVHAAVAAERAELLGVCRAVPVEQREAQARAWIAGRCASDAPASLWSRRNVLFCREDRRAAVLDGLPAGLWQAVVSFGLRLLASVEGFGYCRDRTGAAPRTAGGHPLPLLELHGVMAWLDDLIFGRSAPRAALCASLAQAD